MSEEQPEAVEFVQLGTVADIVMGQSPVGDACNRSGVGDPLLNGPTEFGPRSPVPAQWTTAPSRFAETDDVLFCVRGSTTGRMNIADQRYCVGRGIAAIRGKSATDTQFVYHAITANLDELLSLTTGTVFPNISGADLRGFEIPWPAPKQRRRIAEVLSTLDESVRAKRSLVASLDVAIEVEGAVALYSGASSESSRLTDIATVTNGYSYASSELVEESETAMVNLKNFGRRGGFRLDGLKPFDGKPKVDQMLAVGDALVAKTDLTQNAEVVGRCLRMPRLTQFTRYVGSLDVAIVRSRGEVPQAVLVALLAQPEFREHCVGFTNGTTVLHMSKEALNTYELPLLEPEWSEKLALHVEIIASLQDQVFGELHLLEQLREVLLPALVAGDLRIGLAEELVEAAL